MKRCFGDGDPLYENYHDAEWGRPVIDEHGLYERLCLEAFQAGLSWRTVLHKRAALRAVFADFDPERVARYRQGDVIRLMHDEAIIRNRAKIEATIANARSVLALRATEKPLVALVWSFASSRSPPPRSGDDRPATTPESVALAQALRAHGFRFVGPTTGERSPGGLFRAHGSRARAHSSYRGSDRRGGVCRGLIRPCSIFHWRWFWVVET